MYQQITLIGNVGNDPEMRYTPGGDAVTSFSLATSESWTDKAGERVEKTTWFRVTTWRKTAEIVSQYLTKGRQVMVVGKMSESRPYQNKAGEWSSSLEMTATEVKFLGSRQDVAAQSNGAAVAERTPEGEEIPF